MTDNTFWRWYGRIVAVAAAAGLGVLFWKAAAPATPWWTNPASIALVSTLVGAIVPTTAFIANWAKIQLDTRRQAYEIAQAQAKQTHEITTDYLNRALDPAFPIALRYQLLRFLSTSEKDGHKLENWAEGELKRLDPILQSLSRDVEQAHAAVLKATDPKELLVAEEKLRSALGRLGNATEEPKPPPVTPAALKAGFMLYKNLGSVEFLGEDLRDANFQGCKLVNSDFTRSDLSNANFYEADARGSCFLDCNLTHASLRSADLRGANLRHSDLSGTKLTKARLEGSELFGAQLPKDNLGACYDAKTVWPDGFDPVAAGCILIETPT
jgi:hypothetical protein